MDKMRKRKKEALRKGRTIAAVILVAAVLLCFVPQGFAAPSYADTSRFTLTGETYPTTLKIGTPFTLRGTLKGTKTITAVDIGVLNRANGKYVSGLHYKKTGLNTKTYDIANADSSLKFGSLPTGEYYYRIKATDSSGTQTVLKKAFKVTEANGTLFTLTGATYPTTLKKGTSFTLRGTLKSNKTIKAVHIGVLKKSTGKYVTGFHFSKTGLSTKTYDIANADSSLKFGKLPAGEYYYRIRVTDTNGTKNVLKKAFTVKDPNTSAAATDSNRFKVTGATYPVILNKGSSFTLKGTLTCTNKMSRVDVGVVSKSTGKYVSGYHFKKTGLSTKTYAIANADSSLKFGSLPTGNYYYQIKGTDKSGTVRVLRKAFTVVNPTSSDRFKVSSASYPKTLSKGDSFTLKGTLNCANKMSRVDIGVVNKSTGKYVSGFHYTKTGLSTRTYSIAKADSALAFSKLPAGEYYYQIKAKDHIGTVRVLRKAFTVVDPKAAARFKVTGVTYPTKLTMGKSFTLEGTLTGTYKMSRVDVGVVSRKTGKYVSGFHYKETGLSTKSYDIANADSSLKFGNLPAGSYYYQIKGTDRYGTVRVLRKAFTVVDPAAGSGVTDKEFKANLKEQGFPSTYITPLMALHKTHPKWVFYAEKTGVAWDDLYAKEKVIGRSLIEPTADAAYINQKYRKNNYDGNLKQASDAAILYYLDPRNFLTERDIFQFLDQRSSANPGTKAQVTALVSQNSCFMNTPTYISTLITAGKNSGVNPVVLTTMVIQEQGWRGTSDLISGKNNAYPGIYNHFNVGAYTADGMSKIIRGLWWAKGAGTGATSFGRPWNSIEKSLTGGAAHYRKGYIDNDQYTYYTKKFNVLNGLANVGSNQYMTNIDGACGEGRMLRQAYAADQTKLVFRIPVYTGMPSTPCPAP